MNTGSFFLFFFSLFFTGTMHTATAPDSSLSTTVMPLESYAETSSSDTSAPTTVTSVATTSSDTEKLATCLTEKGAQMYGAYWCPHCADQKAMFGSAFSRIKYTECDPKGENANPKACQAAGVEGYPTWTFPDGTKLTGTQKLEELAKVAQCN